MGVNVILPVRVRLDPEAWRDDPGALENAIRVAAARGLAGAREAVFAPRGGYARARLAAPDICFTGPGMGLIGADERDRISDAVQAALREVGTAFAADIGTLGETGPEPLRKGDTARFDPDRAALGDSAYLLDSYGSDARVPNAAVAALKGKPKAPPPPPRTVRALMTVEPTIKAILEAGSFYLSAVVTNDYAAEYADYSWIGVFFRNARTGRDWLAIFKVKLVEGLLIYDGGDRFGEQSDFVRQSSSVGAAAETGTPLDAGEAQLWERIGSASIATVQQLADTVGDVRAAAGSSDKEIKDWEQNPKLSPAQRKALDEYRAAGRAQWYRNDMLRQFEAVIKGPGPYRVYQVNGADSFYTFHPDMTLDFARLRVIPLLEDIVVAAEAANQAGSGGGATGEPGQAAGGKPGGREGGAEGGEGFRDGERSDKPCAAYCFEDPDEESHTYDGIEVDLIVGPFECEPEAAEFGDLGTEMLALMQEIARDLDIADRDWKYAGAFAINAVRMLRARAARAPKYDPGAIGEGRMVAYGSGNFGDLELTIGESAGIQMLRGLGATAQKVRRLHAKIERALGPSSDFLSTCGKQQFGSRWALHYLIAYADAAKDSGYRIFAEGCRVVMLQLLEASKRGIDWIEANFDDWWKTVSPLMLGMVKRVVELRRMREQILQAEAKNLWSPTMVPLADDPAGGFDPRGFAGVKAGAIATAQTGYQAWRDTREWWNDGLYGAVDRLKAEAAARNRIEGKLVRQRDGSFGVEEVRNGERRVWTKEELESAIATTQQTAESANPIVKHLNNLEGSAAAFENGDAVAKAYLRGVVRKMKDANREAREETRDNLLFAFRTAPLTKDYNAPTIPGTALKLSNIHAMAHTAIGEAFGDNFIYVEGVNYLFASEMGWKSLRPFLELVLTVGAFVIFAPAGFLLSAGLAADRYLDAQAHGALVEGLIDPDEIMSRVEVEMEMFMSHFEIALLVIPEAGTLAKRGIQGLRMLKQLGPRAGVRAIGRQATAHVMEEFAQGLKGDLLKAFVHQLATAKLLEPVMEAALGPVFETIMKEASLGRVGGGAGGPGQADKLTPEELSARLQFLAEYGDVDIVPDFVPDRNDVP